MDIGSYIAKHKFKEIVCGNATVKYNKVTGNQFRWVCSHWLGYIQIDTENVAQFYCSDCDLVHTYAVDANGVVTRKKSKNKRRIGTSEEIAIMG